MLTPSAFQVPILAHFSAIPTAGHLQVEAKAGSGKTTTIIQGLGRCPEPALVLAFNKSIATELESRLAAAPASQPHTAATFNSVGHRALGKMLRKRLTLNTKKIPGLLADLDLPLAIRYEAERIIDRARTIGLVPASCSVPGLVPDDDATWDQLLSESSPDLTADLLRPILEKSFALATAGTIDFADQLYMPVVCSAPFARFPTVVCDEAQDISPIQHEILQRSLAYKAALVTVGDTHQAIYAFRGADSRSMASLRTRFPGTTLPLSVSYRCPIAIIEHVQRWVPDILAAPTAIDGLVEFLDTDWTLADIPFGSFILCRNNAPLLGVAIQALTTGTPFSLSSRDIGGQLTGLLKKLAPRPTSTTTFLSALSAHSAREVARRPRSQAYWSDITDCFTVLSQSANDTARLQHNLDAIFKAPPSARLTLSTIHKAKGLESDNVVILNRGLFGRFAKTEEDKQQEINLQYVAATRARRRLAYIELQQKEA